MEMDSKQLQSGLNSTLQESVSSDFNVIPNFLESTVINVINMSQISGGQAAPIQIFVGWGAWSGGSNEGHIEKWWYVGSWKVGVEPPVFLAIPALQITSLITPTLHVAY